ncbi:MAG: ABC transporter permease [Anaerolineae bacterium]|nr:MAG: ABC transporter permease [Anaerolineae bacterium]
MKDVLLVMRHEIVTIFTRRSFLFTTFGIPLIGFLLFLGFTRVNESNPEAISNLVARPTVTLPEGFVDEAGLIDTIPSDIPAGQLLEFPNEAEARAALLAGDITAYTVIPPDFITRGEVRLVSPEVSPISNSENGWMRWAVRVNLSGGDETLAARLNQPLVVEQVSLAPETPNQDNPLSYWVPYALTFLLYMFILTSSGTLLASVANEKSNRTIEVLLLSISPKQMLTGKILGLGVAGLLQTAIYIGVSTTLLRLAGRTSPMAAGFDFPPETLLWTVLFFVLGYLLYGSLMAAVGALVANVRDASSITIVVISPLIIALILLSLVLEEPMSPIAVGLSLFPFTAPILMVTRLAIGGIPAWQPAVAALGILAMAVVVILATARLFRAQTLLAGQPASLRIFLKAMTSGK